MESSTVTKIPVKYVQPIESVYIKLEDGTDVFWHNHRIAKTKPVSINIEWIDGQAYRVSTLTAKGDGER